MQPAPQPSVQKVQTGPQSNPSNRDGFTKSEKTKDIRSTNITAAKGILKKKYLI